MVHSGGSRKKKNRKPPTGFSPGRVAHLVGASFHTPKGFGFDPQSGHVWKEAYRCFSFISVFLSPSSSLSKINKYILGWKLKKKKKPHSLQIQPVWILIITLSFTSSVTMGKLLHLPEHPCLVCQTGVSSPPCTDLAKKVCPHHGDSVNKCGRHC